MACYVSVRTRFVGVGVRFYYAFKTPRKLAVLARTVCSFLWRRGCWPEGNPESGLDFRGNVFDEFWRGGKIWSQLD